MRRLDQLLSSFGLCPRRQAADWVAAGRVCIDGVPARRADQKADPHAVTVDGAPLEAPDGLVALLHKPVGYVCTHADGEGPTIYQLLPARWLARQPPVTSAGRLDKDTSGLLIVTDRGDLVHAHTSPKSHLEKVYEVGVNRDLDPALVGVFAAGTLVLRGESTPCRPAKLVLTGPRSAELTLTEGRYHQVRRMFASQGWHVETLHRSRIGDCTLDGLAPGEWRLL